MLLATHRNFRLIWLGQLVSLLGDKVFALTLSWWILEITTGTEHPRGDPSRVGYLMAAAALPAALVGPLAGGLADRFSRKTLMLLADLSRAGLVAGLAMMAASGRGDHWGLVPCVVAISAFNVLFNPCVQAVLGSIVEQGSLSAALSLISLTRDTSNILGAALGGALVAAVGVVWGFGLDAASFLFSAAMILLMRVPAAPSRPRSPLAMLAEGLRFVGREGSILRLMGIFALTNLFLAPVLVLLPALARITLQGSALTMGLLEMSMAVGSLLAAAWILRRPSGRCYPVLARSMLVAPVCVLLLASGILPVMLAALLGLGSSLASANIHLRVLFQNLVPDEMKGRVFALIESISTASFPLAFALAGVGTEFLTLPHLLMVCGVGCLLGFLLLVTARTLRPL